MIAELRLKYDQSEKRSAELREAEEKKHMEEVQFLKKTNIQLKVKIFIWFGSSKGMPTYYIRILFR